MSGTLFLPLCQGLESLDFGMVELKESGVSIPVPDPIAVRRALENNRVEVADMSKLETVTLKVTRQTGRSRHAPANEPGEEWKFMVYSEVYSEKMFRAEDFVFHDVKGARLKPVPTCDHSYNEYRGKSFLFRKSPRFVEVAAPVPGGLPHQAGSREYQNRDRRRGAGSPSGACGGSSGRFRFPLIGLQLSPIASPLRRALPPWANPESRVPAAAVFWALALARPMYCSMFARLYRDWAFLMAAAASS